MKFRKIDDFVFEDKKVLLRADFNVPLDDSGNITNDKRIRASIPTIKKLLDKGAKQIIVISHLGRPDGIVDKLKMDNVAKRLQELIGIEVVKFDDCIGVRAEDDKKLVMMENLRFYKEETDNDEDFGRQLAGLAHVYVNDAFAVCHREHASVSAVTKFLPGCAGLLVEKEISEISKLMNFPERPFIAVLGGLKVKDKIGVIDSLLAKVDKLLIGGAMMFTFLKAKGSDVGDSIVDESKIQYAKSCILNPKLVLPVDTLCGKEMKDDTETKLFCENIEDGWRGLDIGDKTIELFIQELSKARSILWNGPMGWFESEKFSKGTKKIAEAVASSDAFSVVGGGESAAAVELYNLEEKITHVSTGGGACLQLIEGKDLPAIKALERNIILFPQQ